MGDGHLGKCKTCTKKDVKKRYYNPESQKRIIDYEKARYQTPLRREATRRYAAKMKLVHPGKAKARQSVSNAVRDGRLSKGPCEVCGSLKVEGHHTDYRKPLEVKWLCRFHHRIIENKIPWVQQEQVAC